MTSLEFSLLTIPLEITWASRKITNCGLEKKNSSEQHKFSMKYAQRQSLMIIKLTQGRCQSKSNMIFGLWMQCGQRSTCSSCELLIKLTNVPILIAAKGSRPTDCKCFYSTSFHFLLSTCMQQVV